MNSKIIIAVIVVAIIVLGGYFLLRNLRSPVPSSNLPTAPSTSNQQPASPSPTTRESVTRTTPAVEQNVVTYTDSGYSPGTLRVKVGTTVIFKNESSRSMWTASAVHPTHRSYPTTGGCIGSTFDACKGIQPGGSWSFKFDVTGTWKYHNHLSPGDTGTIVVE